jgi:hypothetical protein
MNRISDMLGWGKPSREERLKSIGAKIAEMDKRVQAVANKYPDRGQQLLDNWGKVRFKYDSMAYKQPVQTVQYGQPAQQSEPTGMGTGAGVTGFLQNQASRYGGVKATEETDFNIPQTDIGVVPQLGAEPKFNLGGPRNDLDANTGAAPAQTEIDKSIPVPEVFRGMEDDYRRWMTKQQRKDDLVNRYTFGVVGNLFDEFGEPVGTPDQMQGPNPMYQQIAEGREAIRPKPATTAGEFAADLAADITDPYMGLSIKAGAGLAKNIAKGAGRRMAAATYAGGIYAQREKYPSKQDWAIATLESMVTWPLLEGTGEVLGRGGVLFAKDLRNMLRRARGSGQAVQAGPKALPKYAGQEEAEALRPEDYEVLDEAIKTLAAANENPAAAKDVMDQWAKRRARLGLPESEAAKKQAAARAKLGVERKGEKTLYTMPPEGTLSVEQKSALRHNVPLTWESGEKTGHPAGDTYLELKTMDAQKRESIERAAQLTQTNPTEAQKQAGNYAKGKVAMHGMEISIENPAGSVRSGTDKSGKPWQQEMKLHYGYIKGTRGPDKDHVDIFLGPNSTSSDLPVFVVDQIDPKTGKYDEPKALIGFRNEAEAADGYLANYEPGWGGIGAINRFKTIGEFKKWAFSPQAQKPISYIDTRLPSTFVVRKKRPDGQVDRPAVGVNTEELAGKPLDTNDLPVVKPVTTEVTTEATTPGTYQPKERFNAKTGKVEQVAVKKRGKKRGQYSVAAWVRAQGGINPEQLKLHGIDKRNNALVYKRVANKNGTGLDDLAQTAINENIIPHPPSGRNPGEWLVENLNGRILGQEHVALPTRSGESTAPASAVTKAAKQFEGFEPQEPGAVPAGLLDKGEVVWYDNDAYKVVESSGEKVRLKDGKEIELPRHTEVELIGKTEAKGGRVEAAKAKEPLVIDEETFFAMNGAGRNEIGDSALHKNIQEGKAKRDMLKRQSKKDLEIIEKRDKLRKEYNDKVTSGEIRPPTRIERLHETANGIEDNEAVQAARRLLQKKGIDWQKPLEQQTIPGEGGSAKTIKDQAGLFDYAPAPAAANGGKPKPKEQLGLDLGVQAQMPAGKVGGVGKSAESIEGGLFAPETPKQTDLFGEDAVARLTQAIDEQAPEKIMANGLIWGRRPDGSYASGKQRMTAGEIARVKNGSKWAEDMLSGGKKGIVSDVEKPYISANKSKGPISSDPMAQTLADVHVSTNVGAKQRIYETERAISRFNRYAGRPATKEETAHIRREVKRYFDTGEKTINGVSYGTSVWDAGTARGKGPIYKGKQFGKYPSRIREQLEFNFDEAEKEIKKIEAVSTARGALPANKPGKRAPRVVALGITVPQDLKKRGWAEFIGQRISAADPAGDIAKIAMTYRNPKFETLRIYYVRNGRLAGYEGLTCRMPGFVTFTENPVKFRHIINRRADRLRADAIYMSHNHPSGDAAPSEQDINSTHHTRNGKINPVTRLKGHVVTDHGKYTFIDPITKNVEEKTISLEEKKLLPNFGVPAIPNDNLGKAILSDLDVAEVGSSISNMKDSFTLLYTSRGKIRAIHEVPIEFFNKKNYKNATGWLKNRARDFGSQKIYAFMNSNSVSSQEFDDLARYVKFGSLGDVVCYRDAGVVSLMENLDYCELKRSQSYLYGKHEDAYKTFRVADVQGDYGAVDKKRLEKTPKGVNLEKAPGGDMKYYKLKTEDIINMDDHHRPDLSGRKIIGYRYGKAPEGGRSYNSMEHQYENGVSLATIYGKKEFNLFAAQALKERGVKKYYYYGEFAGFGGDDEVLIKNIKQLSQQEYKKLSEDEDIYESSLAVLVHEYNRGRRLETRTYKVPDLDDRKNAIIKFHKEILRKNKKKASLLGLKRKENQSLFAVAPMGALAGVDEDDEGNITYDFGKGLAGALAGGLMVGMAGRRGDRRQRLKVARAKKELAKLLDKVGREDLVRYAAARGYRNKLTPEQIFAMAEDVKKGAPGPAWEGLPIPPNLKAIKRAKELAEWSELPADAKQWLEKAITPIVTRAENINPKLGMKLRNLEWNIAKNNADDHRAVFPWLEKIAKIEKENPLDYEKIKLLAWNRDTAGLGKYLDKYNLRGEWRQFRDMADELFKRAKAQGFNIRYLKDWYPRRIDDAKGFLDYCSANLENFSSIEAQIAAFEKEHGPMNEDQKAQFINSLLRGRKETIDIPATANMKGREVKEVTPEMARFYMDMKEGLIRAINEINEAVEMRKFFGIHAKAKKEAPAAETDQLEFLFDSGADAAVHEDGAIDIDNSIGALVRDLVDRGEINYRQEQELKDIFTARFRQKGASGLGALYKNIQYLLTMNNFNNSMTQLKDVAFSAARGGFGGAVKNFGKSITGKQALTKESINIESIAHEFMSDRKSGKLVSNMFKRIGLEALDKAGKDTYMNTVIEKYGKDIRAGGRRLDDAKYRLQRYFPEDVAETVAQDLAANRKTDLVKELAFYEVGDVQPTTPSNLPEGFLRGGNYRLLYMYKTFYITQLDNLRREAFREMNRGHWRRGFKNLFRLVGGMIAIGVPVDMAKDYLMNRPIDLTDKVVDNIANILGVSKYTMYKAREEGAGRALLANELPPTAGFDEIGKDIVGIYGWLADDKKFPGLETPRRLPMVGSPYYWYLGPGKAKSDRKAELMRKKKMRVERIKKGERLERSH